LVTCHRYPVIDLGNGSYHANGRNLGRVGRLHRSLAAQAGAVKSRGEAGQREGPALAPVAYSASSIVRGGSVAALQGLSKPGLHAAAVCTLPCMQPGEVAAIDTGRPGEGQQADSAAAFLNLRHQAPATLGGSPPGHTQRVGGGAQASPHQPLGQCFPFHGGGHMSPGWSSLVGEGLVPCFCAARRTVVSMRPTLLSDSRARSAPPDRRKVEPLFLRFASLLISYRLVA
jgi:hypothetical protein